LPDTIIGVAPATTCESPCVEALVAGFAPCSLDGLFDTVGGEYSEYDRDLLLESQAAHTARHLTRDVIEVRGGAANHRAQCDDRVELLGTSEPRANEWDLPRARHAHDDYLLARNAMTPQTVECTLDQAIDDHGVEARRHDRKPCRGRRDQRPFQYPR
jgi:hypothetical protein